jgi:hypothetical protein
VRKHFIALLLFLMSRDSKKRGGGKNSLKISAPLPLIEIDLSNDPTSAKSISLDSTFNGLKKHPLVK